MTEFIDLTRLPDEVTSYLLEKADYCTALEDGNQDCSLSKPQPDGFMTTAEVVIGLSLKSIDNRVLGIFGYEANIKTGQVEPIQSPYNLQPNGLMPRIVADATSSPIALTFAHDALASKVMAYTGARPTEAQRWRLEQLFLIAQVAVAMARSLTSAEAGTLAGEFYGDWNNPSAKSQYHVEKLSHLVTQIIPAMEAEILSDPHLTVQEAFYNHNADNFLPDLSDQETQHDWLATFGYIQNLSFEEATSESDITTQSLGVMRFCRKLGYADQALRIALRQFAPHITTYLTQNPELTQPLHTLARSAESLTGNDLLNFLQKIDSEEVLLKAEVLFNNIDSSQFSADEKIMFDELLDATDPHGEWFNLADSTKHTLAKNAFLGTIAFGLTAGTLAGLAYLGSALVGEVAYTALLSGRMAQLATTAITAPVFLGFEYALQGKNLFNQPHWVQETIWCGLTLGLIRFKNIPLNNFFKTPQFRYFLTNIPPSLRGLVQGFVLQGQTDVATLLVARIVQEGFYTGDVSVLYEFDEALIELEGITLPITAAHVTAPVKTPLEISKGQRKILSDELIVPEEPLTPVDRNNSPPGVRAPFSNENPMADSWQRDPTSEEISRDPVDEWLHGNGHDKSDQTAPEMVRTIGADRQTEELHPYDEETATEAKQIASPVLLDKAMDMVGRYLDLIKQRSRILTDAIEHEPGRSDSELETKVYLYLVTRIADNIYRFSLANGGTIQEPGAERVSFWLDALEKETFDHSFQAIESDNSF